MLINVPVLLIGLISGFTIIIFGISAPISIPLLLLLGYSINSVKGPVLIADVIFAILASLFYKRIGKINWKISFLLLSGIFGVLLGVYVSTILSEFITVLITALFEIFMGIFILYDGAKNMSRSSSFSILPHKYPSLVLVGFIAGFFKGYLGMGWGPVAIPILVIFGINSYVVIASSLVSRIIISLTGGLSYMALGYIDVIILIKKLIGGIIGIFLSTRVEKKIDEDDHKRMIGIFIAFLGIIMLFQ